MHIATPRRTRHQHCQLRYRVEVQGLAIYIYIYMDAEAECISKTPKALGSNIPLKPYILNQPSPKKLAASLDGGHLRQQQSTGSGPPCLGAWAVLDSKGLGGASLWNT